MSNQAFVVVKVFSHTVALGLCLTTTEAVTRANGVAVAIVVQVSIACTHLADVWKICPHNSIPFPLPKVGI